MPTVGFLKALWFSIIGFIERLFFNKSPSSSLPLPITSQPTSDSVRVSPWSSPFSASARSPTEIPFPNISLSPLLTSPPDIALGPFSPSSPSSAVTVHLDRSNVPSPTANLKEADFPRLPSPWSPVGELASSDVWMSVNGSLVNAARPVIDCPSPAPSQDDSLTVWTTLSRMSTTSLCSSSSALDAFGISALVHLDQVQDNHADPRDDPPTPVSKWTHPTLVTPPRKRRETISSAPYAGARATKCLSTPLTKLDNVGVSHVRSATSISSMAYEFRMGLFADGRSMTALENIISLLDQASPESRLELTQPVVVVN